MSMPAAASGPTSLMGLFGSGWVGGWLNRRKGKWVGGWDVLKRPSFLAVEAEEVVVVLPEGTAVGDCEESNA